MLETIAHVPPAHQDQYRDPPEWYWRLKCSNLKTATIPVTLLRFGAHARGFLKARTPSPS
eukprot:4295589-Prymnesium_polylepis.2